MVGAALNVMAMATQERGHTAEAMRYAERAITVARDSGDLEAEARALGNMGVLYHLRADAEGSRSDYQEAARYYEQQVEMSRRLALAAPTAWATANVAQVALRLGDEKAATERLVSAIEALLGCGGELNFCLIVGAELLFARGAIPQALALLGAVRSNPSSTTDRHQEIERVLARFDVEPDRVAEGMRAGEGQDERRLVERLLEELGASGVRLVRSPASARGSAGPASD
jgi:tetratricopeptide (TPR) repeat protein